MMNSKTYTNFNLISKIFENNFFEKIKITDFTNNIEINELLDSNIILKEDNYISLNYNFESNRLLKKYVDQTIFNNLNKKLQNEILFIQNELKKLNRNKIFTIFLIGSVSRNTFGENSDIDFLIIHSNNDIIKPKIVNTTRKIQIITKSKKDIRYHRNDEILLWALKYGILLYDRNYIFNSINGRIFDYQEIILKKRSQIEHTCILIEDMIEKKTFDLNKENIIPKLVHLISRYILLLNNKFPLSRPELKKQIQDTIELNTINNIKTFDELFSFEKNDVKTYLRIKKIFKKFINSSNSYI